MNHRWFTLATSALALCVIAAHTYAENGGPWVPNEWGPLSGIVLSTETGENNKEVLNPLAPKIIEVAVNQGLTVVIADRGDAAAIIQTLKDQKVITDQTAHLVKVTTAPLQNGWARDTGPIARLQGKNAPDLTGTMAYIGDWTEAKAQAANQAIAQALGTRSASIPTFTAETQQGPETLPIQADGGNWLPTTLQDKKILITTVEDIYYGDLGFSDQANKLLKKEFGISQVLTIAPIPQETAGYQKMANNHLDLQIRTLPNNQVLVADVPAGDPLKAPLNKIAQDLTQAGFTVIRIPNTQSIKSADGKLIFTSYTNAVPINNVWLVPQYGDAAADAAALKIYRDALGPGFKVEPVDVSSVAATCGALRCALREISAAARALPVLPSVPRGKEASSKGNPRVSFDATTLALDFSPGQLNFLGSPNGTFSDPDYADDILNGATLQVMGLTLNRGMSEGSQYTFIDGELVISSNGMDLFTAKIPVFTINGTWPDAALATSGILAAYDIGPGLEASPWFQDFTREVLQNPSLLPDVFAVSSVDLVALSNGFTASFNDVELQRLGIVGNGNMPEPTTIALIGLGLAGLGATRRFRTVS